MTQIDISYPSSTPCCHVCKRGSGHKVMVVKIGDIHVQLCKVCRENLMEVIR